LISRVLQFESLNWVAPANVRSLALQEAECCQP
jgi:hypothetical protein